MTRATIWKVASQTLLTSLELKDWHTAGDLSLNPFCSDLSCNALKSQEMGLTLSGVLIASSFVQTYAILPRMKNACPPNDPTARNTASRFSRIVLWISAAIYAIGFFAASILGPLLAKFD